MVVRPSTERKNKGEALLVVPRVNMATMAQTNTACCAAIDDYYYSVEPQLKSGQVFGIRIHVWTMAGEEIKIHNDFFSRVHQNVDRFLYRFIDWLTCLVYHQFIRCLSSYYRSAGWGIIWLATNNKQKLIRYKSGECRLLYISLKWRLKNRWTGEVSDIR